MRLGPLLVLLPFGAVACVTVRPVVAPASFIATRQPALVWVTAADHEGQTIPLARPTIRGDSLQGVWLGTSERMSLALPRVTSMTARQPDPTRTALLVASAALLGGFLAWRASNTGGQSSPCVFDPRSGWDCTPP